jgi:predicted nucleic-acid-binding protein
MIGLDTNVLVRLLVVDDADQTNRARRLVRGALESAEPVLVSLPVLLETEWVLRSRYELGKAEILAAFRGLLETRELTFEDEPAIEEALLRRDEHTIGFADCLIAAHNRRLGCTATATFDGKAARVPGFAAV